MSSTTSVQLDRFRGSNGSSRVGDKPDPLGKKVREESRGIFVEKELKRTKTFKLAVPFDAKFGKLMLKNRKMLVQYVRDSIPPTILSWVDIKKKDIELIFQRLELMFEFPHDNVLFMDDSYVDHDEDLERSVEQHEETF
ncbi:hypothetical protein PanWU01x14_166200 [Parasponia andersonii]|uniref:Uncharacterized protein n=1 Tax=Parasponia andersonii TaxID=3476 RepID=A0A2P5CBK3_PARAD|nr:hypothetical protein PanWU01x14_166200 [Parasponia andersonii]